MKLSLKDYKILKTKKYVKTNNLFFFANGTSKNSLDWLNTEQSLKIIEFSYYRLLNKITQKALNDSIYTNIKSIISGPAFLIKPNLKRPLLKQTIKNNFDLLFFELLMIKFNNKLYSSSFLKNFYSFNYKETKLLFYQFNLINVKLCSKLSK